MELTPAEAYAHANQLALDRMNGYRVDYHSSVGCDFMSGDQQLPDFPPVKSQITEQGHHLRRCAPRGSLQHPPLQR
ncbi:MAG: hypothetical protein KatS3mg051_1613 [Anaerolineae bacterium]|nr:MAG: hypothetical protein KatS3mg051_1613 [Anaerolineae bacterium]